MFTCVMLCRRCVLYSPAPSSSTSPEVRRVPTSRSLYSVQCTVYKCLYKHGDWLTVLPHVGAVVFIVPVVVTIAQIDVVEMVSVSKHNFLQ